MAVHPASNTNTVIPRTAITMLDLAFTVITLSHHTTPDLDCQDRDE